MTVQQLKDFLNNNQRKAVFCLVNGTDGSICVKVDRKDFMSQACPDNVDGDLPSGFTAQVDGRDIFVTSA